jgi:HD-like signal output (HDOD) protein
MLPYMVKIEQDARLITLPEIYFRLKELLAEPDFAMAEVAILISRDPALATRVLRIINNPLNRRIRKIESVSHAVSLLGVRQIHDIVLAASVTEAFRHEFAAIISLKQFWRRSIYCASLLQILAEDAGVSKRDSLFVVGLLHDIGHLFMWLAFHEESQHLVVAAHKEQRPLFLLEREFFGFDYAEVGGHMLSKWGLPRSLWGPVRFHTEPDQVKPFSFESSLLHLSSNLVQADLEQGEFDSGPFMVNKSAWEFAGVTKEQCHEAQQAALATYEEVCRCILME